MILSWSPDKLGPIARTAEDCALILGAICGSDGKDPCAIDMPYQWPSPRSLSDLRVGYVKSAFEDNSQADPSSTQVLKALRDMGVDLREHKPNDNRVLTVLRNMGIDLIPVELPDLDLEPLMIILYAEGAAAFDELTRSNQDDLITGQDSRSLPNRFRQGRFVPAVEYIQANRIRVLQMQEMAQVMAKVDMFLVPQLAANNLTLTNLTGHPTVGVPNGFTETGMPTGINIVGSLFGEADLLTLAKAFQDATLFNERHPTLTV